ncbi:EamA family transporter RarD [Bartonella sp. LJL80]
MKKSEPLPIIPTPNLSGFAAAFGAYLIWGIFPLYMKAVAHIPVMEVVAHRILWALPTALIILVCLGRTKDLMAALRTPHMVAMACLTSALITMNWSVYIWAIANNHAVDAALGYYINPLFNVMLGLVFLRERLDFWQWISVGLAFFAVAILTIHAGGLPWVAVLLPITFGLYGFFRKSLPIGPAQGFALETILLFIPAIALAGYFFWTGNYHFAHGSWQDTGLLIMAGPFTAIPLILFATGAKRLSLITLGLMQYLTPTFLFLIAIFVFKEPFSRIQLMAFSLIWLGLIIYTISSFVSMKRRKTIETIVKLPSQ